MNACKQKKLNFRVSKKQLMPLKLFEFLEQFMTGTFDKTIKLTQSEKIGSKGKFFISLGADFLISLGMN